MANVIVSVILILVVGWACAYLWKAKKNGRKCIGCPYSGDASCHCNKK